MATQPISHTVTVPANNGETFILDSSRGFVQAVTAAASRLAPGTFRNRWAGKRLHLFIKNGDQAITINLLAMIDPTLTTSSAWAVDTTADLGGVIAVAASTEKVIKWLPPTSDWAVEAAMGATATSALSVTGWMTDDPHPGT